MKGNNKMSKKVSISSSVSVISDKTLASTIRQRIVSLVDRKGGMWEGSMTELDKALRSVSKQKTPTNWPGSPSVMRKVVNTVVHSLRREGVSVAFGRETDHFRKRFVSFEAR